GKVLIESKAPADLIDLEKQTIPTVAALLQKSVNMLDARARACFAYLFPYHENPVFSLEELRVSWGLEDPRPVIKQLTGQGILERIDNRYRMHSLFCLLAKSVLDKI